MTHIYGNCISYISNWLLLYFKYNTVWPWCPTVSSEIVSMFPFYSRPRPNDDWITFTHQQISLIVYPFLIVSLNVSIVLFVPFIEMFSPFCILNVLMFGARPLKDLLSQYLLLFCLCPHNYYNSIKRTLGIL